LAQQSILPTKFKWFPGVFLMVLHAIIKFGFEEIKVNKIWAEHKTFNIGSGRVMEKAGMRH
jgi:ribosomal-protein-alanine N-acetyltransferase